MHYLTWFRRGLDDGLDRKAAAMLAYERCATAMTQTTLIGGLGLSMFAFSTFTPTQRFGVLMLTLLGAALFGDLIFLPALLSGPIGRFFRVGKKKPPEGPPGDGTAARRTDGDLHEDGAHKHAAPGKATARPRMGHSSMPPPHTRSSQRSPTAP
jgi:hypothetical protein